MAPVDPKNPASPKENTPPSPPINQYPPLSGVAAIDTIGMARWRAPTPL